MTNSERTLKAMKRMDKAWTTFYNAKRNLEKAVERMTEEERHNFEFANNLSHNALSCVDDLVNNMGC